MTKEVAMTNVQRFLVCVALVVAVVAAARAIGQDDVGVDLKLFTVEDGSLVVFNGKDLTGWDGDPKIWSVKDGAIVGKHDGLNHNDFLKSKFAAGDFRLTLKVKLVDNNRNSGIQFRSERFGEHEMKGYQADMGAGWWGKLYEESARGLLVKEGGEKFVKVGDWNEYEIVAVGDHVLMALNGHKVVDFKDPKGMKKGIFALQVHSDEKPTEAHFKDLRLELNPKAELETVK
jgi:hypothetical protein